MDTFFNNLLPFIAKHWLLTATLIVIILLIVVEETRKKVRGVQRISPTEVVTLINRENAVVIDIRDNNAFSNGHIVNAMNLPHDQLEARLDKMNKYKDKPIVVVCGNGQNAVTVGAKLYKQGFAKIYSLTGGMPAWRNANLPLQKS